MRILLVEDDEILLTLLKQRLVEEHYAVDAVADGIKGWDYATTYEYDLLILDVGLPKLDGIALCQKLRLAEYTLPILMLTSRDTSNAKIMGLDAGADDYVVKPFDQAELVARIRALLRRGSINPLPILTWGDLCLNSSTQEVSYGEQILTLTAKEYALLEMMMRESQHVFSNEEILQSLWSSEEFPVDATVRSHMRRLRSKLTVLGAPPDLIATSHGRGYYLRPLPPDLEPPKATAETVAKEAKYLELLNQTWQKNRSTCLDRCEVIRSALVALQSGQLTPPIQAEAHRMAHTLIGTLGTFGLQASRLCRSLEQELHRDLYLEPRQAESLRALLDQIQQEISSTSSLQPDSPIPAVEYPAKPQIRVMLVDDDPLFLQTLSRQLQGYGFQVSTLDNPQQFWTLLEGCHPDVLILDVQMPQINGLELCQALRSGPDWQRLPVMFLSALADAKTQHQAFAMGADDYLCKPITAPTLTDRIHQRLQRIKACFGR
jgi:DNA-binding response OmpR family regulator